MKIKWKELIQVEDVWRKEIGRTQNQDIENGSVVNFSRRSHWVPELSTVPVVTEAGLRFDL